MDLLIFIIFIVVLTGMSIWLSKKLFSVKPPWIFVPSIVLIGLTIVNGTLAMVIPNMTALVYAVLVFIFGPTGLITLVYALNHYHQNKRTLD